MSGHGQRARQSAIPALRLAVVATGALLCFEAVGGFVSHSLALLTDAAHMFTDVGAAALALWAEMVAMRKPDTRRTFGYGRATVLAALANSVALFLIVGAIVYEAIQRFIVPHHVEAHAMLFFAAISTAANLALGFILIRREKQSSNVRAVIVHVFGDAAISAAAVLAAGIIAFTGWLLADPIVSIIAAIVVIRSAWNTSRDAINVLLEGVPSGTNVLEMQEFLRGKLPVQDVHDLHVWSVADGTLAVSLHVRVTEQQLSGSPAITADVKHLLHDAYDVTHCTVEVECIDCADRC